MTIFTPNERLEYSSETRDSSGYNLTPGASGGESGSGLGGSPGGTPVDKLTAGVFARARAQGVGYDAPVAGEYETSAGGLGYNDPDFGTQLMNPANARLQNTFDEAKAKVTRGMRVSPPGRTPQRARLAPTPRVATLVAVFLLAIGGLVVGWQVLSAPPSQPVAGTVETGAGQGSALRAAGTGSRGTNGNPGANGDSGAGGGGGADGAGGSGGASEAYANDPKVAGQSPRLLLPGANGAELVVYVSGQVERPGVVRLADPARVTDALEAAGGAKPGADLRALNLARLVADGEQINVPLPGEAPPPGADAAGGASGAGGSGGGSGGAGGGSGGKGDKVNLNTADATDLQTLSGIGPALAQRILDYRKKNGKFHSIEQLDEVSGIGPAMMERLRDHVIL